MHHLFTCTIKNAYFVACQNCLQQIQTFLESTLKSASYMYKAKCKADKGLKRKLVQD